VRERDAGGVRQVQRRLHAPRGDGAQLRARHQLLHRQPVVLAPEHQRHLPAVVLHASHLSGDAVESPVETRDEPIGTSTEPVGAPVAPYGFYLHVRGELVEEPRGGRVHVPHGALASREPNTHLCVCVREKESESERERQLGTTLPL
jgi:hypothetical protein